MSMPETSVNRPVTVLMAVSAVAIFGFIAASQLPVDLLPDISYPTVTVQTDYPDAAPETVEQFVTRPIEEAVGVIPGVREMRSVSRPGASEVILEFDWDQEMDFAALEVREKLGTVRMPREADIPRVLRFDPSLDPVMRIAFEGDRPLDELRQLADRWLKPRLESVGGVAAAKVRGGLDPEVIVEADEDRLAALGLTLDDLARALRAENINQPGGTLRDFNALYLVRTLHEFDDLEQLRRTVVRETADGRVRVEDVARVLRGHRDREEIARLQGDEVVELALHREGSANTVSTAANLRAEIAEIEKETAEDLKITILSDQSTYIVDAVDQVRSAAWIGGLLAVLVLFFFLRDFPSTVIIALAIPISVIATFLPMRQAGVSLNIMSLGGLALGVGMLVDSSIVVLEAIDRHRRLGKSRRDAAIQGASEVSAAVIASILTTICVFLPIVFVQGVAGQLFRDQALTVCFALMVSLIVSLTLIPSLSAFDFNRFDPRREEGGEEEKSQERLPLTFRLFGFELLPIGDGVGLINRLLTWLLLPVRFVLLLLWIVVLGVAVAVGKTFFLVTAPLARLVDGAEAVYPGMLRRGLRWRWAILAVAVLLFIGSVYVVPYLGTELVPELSQGEFAFQLRLPEGTPLETTADAVGRLERELIKTGNFERIFSVIGSLPSSASGRRNLGENLAQIDFILPTDTEAVAQERIVAMVRDRLARFPRLDAELLNPAVMAVKAPVAVRVFSDEIDAVEKTAEKARELIAGVPGVTDVGSTVEPGNPEVQVELDRERAVSLGLTASSIGTALRHKIQGEVVGQFREGEERIDIRLRAQEAFRDRASEVEDLRLRLADGTVVPVSAVARVEIGRGPAAIYRADGARMAEVTAKIDSADLGRVLEDVGLAVAGLETSRDVRLELAGQNEDLEVSMNSLKLAIALAIFLVYVVMASQFESLLHPFVILMSVPLALIGIVAALWTTQNTISVLALIGGVMLAGIVVNNAIVLVDAVNRRRREGEELTQAVVGAGQERLRPILMTTATTILALLPMALGLGAGDELRAPLAITVIGGLGVATVLTLLVIPCVYVAASPRRARASASEKISASAVAS